MPHGQWCRQDLILGGSRVEGRKLFLMQIQQNSLGEYNNLFK